MKLRKRYEDTGSQQISGVGRGLRTPLFRALVVGWTLANFSDSVLIVILAVWVADLTANAALGGITFAILGLPALVSPYLGFWVDKGSRRRILVVAYIFGAASLTPLLFVRDGRDVWVVYVVACLYAAISYLNAACQSGLLKDTVPESALGQANSLLATIDQVFRIGLPIVGAVVYATFGIVPLVVAASGSFVIAATIFASLRIIETSPVSSGESPVGAAFAGFRHLFGTPSLGAISWTMVVAMAALGVVNGVAFNMLDRLSLPAEWLGPLTIGQGIGGILAGFLAPSLMERFGRGAVCSVGIIVLGFSLIPIAGDSVVWLAGSQFVVGFAVTVAVISYVTERQVKTPGCLQGRVSAASQVVLNLPGVVVTVVAATIAAWVDYRILVLAVVPALVFTGFLALRYGFLSVPQDVKS